MVLVLHDFCHWMTLKSVSLAVDYYRRHPLRSSVLPQASMKPTEVHLQRARTDPRQAKTMEILFLPLPARFPTNSTQQASPSL